MAIFSDIHAPYHSREALTAAIEWSKASFPTHVVLNGDTIDLGTISRHPQEKGKKSLSEEIKATQVLLEIIREEFSEAKIYYKLGNHEKRFELKLMASLPEFADLISLGQALRLKDFDMELVDAHQIIRAGKLNIIHGHEYYGGGLHAAYNTLLS